MLIGWGVSVSIESPLNSPFWKTSWIENLLHQVPGGHDTIWDHCMHGGARDRSSRFWSLNPLKPNDYMLASLALRCDGSHVHKSCKPKVQKWDNLSPDQGRSSLPCGVV